LRLEATLPPRNAASHGGRVDCQRNRQRVVAGSALWSIAAMHETGECLGRHPPNDIHETVRCAYCRSAHRSTNPADARTTGLVEHGKSGGVRVIYFARTHLGKIWMLTIHAKNEMGNISPNALRKIRKELENAETPS